MDAARRGYPVQRPPQFGMRGSPIRANGSTAAALADRLGQLLYGVTHIPQEDNYWWDLLSLWNIAGTDANGVVSESVGCAKMSGPKTTDADYALPPQSATKSSQLQLAAEDPMNEINTSCGVGRCDTEQLFRVSQGVEQVLWILAEGEPQQARRAEHAWEHMDGTLAGGICGW